MQKMGHDTVNFRIRLISTALYRLISMSVMSTVAELNLCYVGISKCKWSGLETYILFLKRIIAFYGRYMC